MLISEDTYNNIISDLNIGGYASGLMLHVFRLTATLKVIKTEKLKPDTTGYLKIISNNIEPLEELIEMWKCLVKPFIRAGGGVFFRARGNLCSVAWDARQTKTGRIDNLDSLELIAVDLS